MKIFLAQQNYHIGNFDKNAEKIIGAIEEAKNKNGDLIVFSELCVCGYPAKDFLYMDDFIDQCYAAIEKIKLHADTIGVIIGAPDRNTSKNGRKLFNAAFFLYEKKIQNIIHKTCLPNYDVFDEARYFEPSKKWEIVSFKEKRIALTICEDIWNIGDNSLYPVCPMDKLMAHQPDLMINISASPFDYTHSENRKATIKLNVSAYKLPLIYCNTVGSQTEMVFDGNSLVFDKEANLCIQLPAFEEAVREVNLMDNGGFDTPISKPSETLPDERVQPFQLNAYLNIGEVYKALISGIKDYFQKMGFTKAIVGSSGGLDSAVTLALACAALGRENVVAVLMPSVFSTSHSISDAEMLSKNLGNPYETIPVGNLYDQFIKELKPVFKDLPFSVAEENIQARTRGVILMALANKFSYILLNTSNKSELAMGYGTLYGDMAGGIGVLGDCYKLQVYELAAFINREKEIIPAHIITKPPSAELRPDQKDIDSLPPYDILDPLLYQYIELGQSPAQIKSLGFDEGLVDRVLKTVNRNEYKRNQFCPIIRISSKAFGPGRRMPVVGSYLG